MAVSLPTHAQLLRKQRKPHGVRAKRFYDKRAWRSASRRHLASHPLCAECERQGRTTLADQVDHKTAIADGGALIDADNMESLCQRCHSRKTTLSDGGFGRGEGGLNCGT